MPARAGKERPALRASWADKKMSESSQSLDDLARPVAREGFEYHDLDDGVVLSSTETDRIHALNVSAAYVWSCLDGSYTIRRIASELHQQTNVPIETALDDVRAVIAHFRAEGLLRSE
jgi:hypothetical protein